MLQLPIYAPQYKWDADLERIFDQMFAQGMGFHAGKRHLTEKLVVRALQQANMNQSRAARVLKAHRNLVARYWGEYLEGCRETEKNRIKSASTSVDVYARKP